MILAQVISQVRYCVSIYGNGTKTNLPRLQNLINYGAKVIFGRKKHDHVSDLLDKLGWLSAENLVTYHDTLGIVCTRYAALNNQKTWPLALLVWLRDETRGKCRPGPLVRTATCYTCPGRALIWGRGASAVAVPCSTMLYRLTWSTFPPHRSRVSSSSICWPCLLRQIDARLSLLGCDA